MLSGIKIVSVTLNQSVEHVGIFVKRNFGCTTPGDYVGPDEINSEGHSRLYISGALAGGIGEEAFTGCKSDGINQDYELVNKCTAKVNPQKAHDLLVSVIANLNLLFKEKDARSAVDELAFLLIQREAYGADVYRIILKHCPTRLLTAAVGRDATES
jgi:hypothetical protein